MCIPILRAARRLSSAGRLLPAAAASLLLGVASLPAEPPAGDPPAAASEAPPAEAPREAAAIRVGAARIEQVGPRRYLFTGDVDIRYGDLRLQADEVEYDDASRQCRARGNVLLEESSSRLSGDQIDLNLETRLATVEHAHGEIEPHLILEAERLEKVADDRLKIYNASVTSCTQPTPYWSFKVGEGTIHLEHYAYLRNVSFRVEKVPVFYSPWLMWPIKEDRASGLLIPEVGYSQRRGTVLNAAYFWAPARNFDSTFYLDYMERSGLGKGIESRWLPGAGGRLRFTGYAVDERIDYTGGGDREGDRYRFHLDADQRLPSDWRLLADLNQVSDFNYPLDFERDLRAATNPSNASQLEITRSWSHYTFNLRGEHREQHLSTDPVTREETTLTQRRLPEIEFRGRSRKLGRSPIYFSFESSAAGLERDFAYGRLDLFPKFRAPFRPAPWLEATPSVSFRETIYTRQSDPSTTASDDFVDERLSRELFRAELDVIGPKYSRVSHTPGWGFTPRVKNVIEPRLLYTYVRDEAAVGGGASRIPVFDEIDTQPDDVHRVTYSLTSRWFALRAAESKGTRLALPRQVPLPGLAPEPQAAPTAGRPAAGGDAAPAPAAPDPAAQPRLNPIEFMTFSVSQSLGFNAPQSFQDGSRSDFSAVNASLRINPSSRQSLNLNSSYNVLRRTVETTTLSADLRAGDHLLNLTWFVRNNPASVTTGDQSQVRLFAGTALFRRKLTFATEANVDLAASLIRDQRYRIGYNTQCCGFMAEVLDRDFAQTQEREYRFLLNLKGVGTLFDLQQGVR